MHYSTAFTAYNVMHAVDVNRLMNLVLLIDERQNREGEYGQAAWKAVSQLQKAVGNALVELHQQQRATFQQQQMELGRQLRQHDETVLRLQQQLQASEKARAQMQKQMLEQEQQSRHLATATTGTAAIRLSKHASTVHTAFGIFGAGRYLPPISPTNPRYEAMRAAKVIIIDEMSMLCSQMFSLVLFRLQQCCECRSFKEVLEQKLIIRGGRLLESCSSSILFDTMRTKSLWSFLTLIRRERPTQQAIDDMFGNNIVSEAKKAAQAIFTKHAPDRIRLLVVRSVDPLLPCCCCPPGAVLLLLALKLVPGQIKSDKQSMALHFQAMFANASEGLAKNLGKNEIMEHRRQALTQLQVGSLVIDIAKMRRNDGWLVALDGVSALVRGYDLAYDLETAQRVQVLIIEIMEQSAIAIGTTRFEKGPNDTY
ncbi:hypothetical protein QJQ45_016191 [Haematococcus lacustris]|nr:hypothetical protein QJQ45_016191 [Haematococcus lacustris]